MRHGIGADVQVDAGKRGTVAGQDQRELAIDVPVLRPLEPGQFAGVPLPPTSPQPRREPCRQAPLGHVQVDVSQVAELGVGVQLAERQPLDEVRPYVERVFEHGERLRQRELSPLVLFRLKFLEQREDLGHVAVPAQRIQVLQRQRVDAGAEDGVINPGGVELGKRPFQLRDFPGCRVELPCSRDNGPVGGAHGVTLPRR